MFNIVIFRNKDNDKVAHKYYGNILFSVQITAKKCMKKLTFGSEYITASSGLTI